MKEVILDTIVDSLKLIPFLFPTTGNKNGIILAFYVLSFLPR